MNLGEYIAKQLLEAEDKQTIALFPGAFKPPTKGHFDGVQQLLKKADQVVVLVSPNPREGITAEQSIAVWNEYKKLLLGNVEIRISSESPVKEAYDVVKNNPDTNFILAFGKGDAERFGRIKYPNAEIIGNDRIKGVSATFLRRALNTNNEQEIEKYLPKGIAVADFINALKGDKPEEKISKQKQFGATSPSDKNPIKESPPLGNNNNYQDYILQNRDKIEKAAYYFNLPIPEMEQCFSSAKEIVLTDEIWKVLENSKSYKIKDLDEAIQYSLKRGIDPKPYIDYIKEGKDLPLPLILCYSQNKYYLVGGDVVLSIFKALGSIPTVLQGNLDLKIQEGLEVNKNNKINVIKEFIKFAVNELKLKKIPKITLSYDNKKVKESCTFGTFEPNNNRIWIYVKNRNLADILRTVGHELNHRKQDEEGRINLNSGNTGSEIENEANAKAGILLRKFGQQNNNIYESLLKENLILHATEELNRAGLFDKDADYGGMIGIAVLDLCKKFVEQGHSGFSAAWVRDLFNKLSNYETLTPITSDPNEWSNVSEMSGYTFWQNRRNPAIFSTDGGQTWYHIDDKKIKEGINIAIKTINQILVENNGK